MNPARATSLDQIRALALSKPDTSERLSHGTPSFFVATKKVFIHVWPTGHHKSRTPQLWCAATMASQGVWRAHHPDICFIPPYVGHRGWIGVRLDLGIELDDLEELLDDAYRCVAPQRLIAELDGTA